MEDAAAESDVSEHFPLRFDEKPPRGWIDGWEWPPRDSKLELMEGRNFRDRLKNGP